MAEVIPSTRGKQVGAYSIRVLNGMAQGLFASLIVGLIIKQIGHYSHLVLLEQFGQIAQYLTGPAIGVGVAVSVGAPPLGILCSAVTGAIGAGTFVLSDNLGIVRLAFGEPVGAMLASLAGAEIAKKIAGKTKIDILLIPISTIIAGGLAGHFVAPAMSAFMTALGAFINSLTELYPLPMGILVSTVMGMVLTLPISSAAICISLGINGLAAGAATVGCCCQMVGFAVMSFPENRVGGLMSQGLGTSMLQIPNICRNWKIWIPPILSSAILGPVSTLVFKMQNNSAGAGMGTSGLVGQLNTLAVMGPSSLPLIALMHFTLPSLLTIAFGYVMRKKGWIGQNDLLLVN